MIQFVLNLPIWHGIRLFGILSYLLLTAGICLGISYSFPNWSGKQRARVYKLHTSATIAGTALGLLHGILTVIDQYMPFGWSGVLIPFTAKNSPLLNGLGTLAGYGMIILILTSDLRSKLNRKVWLSIHMMSYPIFAMAFVHGLFLGTDTALVGIRWMYILSVAAVVGLTMAKSALKSAVPHPDRPVRKRAS